MSSRNGSSSPRNGSSSKDASTLLSVAAALETDLVNLESVSRATRKIPLTSEKNIARATRELQDALSLPERLAAGLQALASAMVTMQARQQAAIETLSGFASQIQQRHQRLQEHMHAYAALGAAAAEVSAGIQSAEGERTAVLRDVDAQLAKIADDARALFEVTQVEDFPELAREADALKQRALSLRRRLHGQA
jgi:predicted  nucleic acid-binding Zn-ribbon protein